jgi:hypothetical protein
MMLTIFCLYRLMHFVSVGTQYALKYSAIHLFIVSLSIIPRTPWFILSLDQSIQGIMQM